VITKHCFYDQLQARNGYQTYISFIYSVVVALCTLLSLLSIIVINIKYIMMIHLDRQRRYTPTRCGKTEHNGSGWVGAFGLVGALILHINMFAPASDDDVVLARPLCESARFA